MLPNAGTLLAAALGMVTVCDQPTEPLDRGWQLLIVIVIVLDDEMEKPDYG